MPSCVCTLFEKEYHNGVAVLVNSLCRAGFRGRVWAGYRGELPSWANPITTEGQYHEYKVQGYECTIRFVKLDTELHLTFVKPDFLLRILDEEPECEFAFYFDPDIVVKLTWELFEDWASWGVAVCEDMASPSYTFSPQRHAWRKFYGTHGYDFHNDHLNVYVNGGFIGVAREFRGFLQEWIRTRELLPFQSSEFRNIYAGNFGSPFWNTDQDALNVALLNTHHPISLRNKQCMGFETGNPFMMHAIGQFKPWFSNFFFRSLQGEYPVNLDLQFSFLAHARRPIRLYSNWQWSWRVIDYLGAKAISALIPSRTPFNRY